MMSSGEFLRLQAIEFGFLAVLAFLPYFVALREVGLTLVFVGISVGVYRVLKKKLARFISPEGRSVFITGCDTGIGHSLARRLVSLGFRVFAGCYRPDQEGARALKAYCGDTVHIVPLDITSDDSVQSALGYVKEQLDEKGLWAVVNNAGQDYFGDAEICTLDIYKRIMDVNAMGSVRVTKAFLPLIRKSKGRIVNVTSVKARIGVPKTAAYTMAKYAGEGFSDVLRVEMRKWGVKVSIIEPGNFGGTTAINKNENYDRIKEEIETMWEKASPEVKEAYGREYHYEMMSGLRGSAATAPSSLAPVIDAMEDALINVDPRARYLIGGSNQLFDIYKLCALMNTVLPEFLTDFVTERSFWTNHPLPQALRR